MISKKAANAQPKQISVLNKLHSSQGIFSKLVISKRQIRTQNPNPKTPVSMNTVSHGYNPRYYLPSDRN